MAEMKVIAIIRSAFPTKFGIPRQSNVVPELQATVVFEPEYRSPEALRGLEAFSHLWLIWGFSEAGRETWSPTVRPPRLGGNTRMGVFATRSPYRPNPIGLSSVRMERIEAHPTLGPVIHVLGADLMDGTPIYDIKPYLPFTDSHPDAATGFVDRPPAPALRVELGDHWDHLLPAAEKQLLSQVLSHDPRPPYQNDPQRIYGLQFNGLEVRFTVEGDTLWVNTVERLAMTNNPMDRNE